MAPGKMRWGDAAESYGSTGASAEAYEIGTSATDLPPPQVFGPDAKGIKTVVEYKYNEEGQKVRITRKTRILRKKKVLSKEMLSRKDWIKFGDAKGILPGTDNLTAVSTDEIFVERPKKLGMKQEEEQPKPDALAALAGTNTSLLVCRICGKKGDHWTSKCPYKDLAGGKGTAEGEAPPEETLPSMPKPGGYVPPSLRAGAGGSALAGESMRRPRDENSVRVTNLSEDTREAELQVLFRPFGQITRIYVAMDRETGESRGFAFINFMRREEAQKAIDTLDGFGFDNLILRVEWAQPREARS